MTEPGRPVDISFMEKVAAIAGERCGDNPGGRTNSHGCGDRATMLFKLHTVRPDTWVCRPCAERYWRGVLDDLAAANARTA